MIAFLIALSFLIAPTAQAADHEVPYITLACELDPSVPSAGLGNGIYTGFDCLKGNAHRKGILSIDESVDPNSLEFYFRVKEQLALLSKKAEKACGKTCRFFYATFGYQCLTVAQNIKFTGFGNFLTLAKNQVEAEELALKNCKIHVGEPYASDCIIAVSECVLKGEPQ